MRKLCYTIDTVKRGEKKIDKRFYELNKEEMQEMRNTLWDAFMEQLKDWIPNYEWEELEELPMSEQDEILENLMNKVKKDL